MSGMQGRVGDAESIGVGVMSIQMYWIIDGECGIVLFKMKADSSIPCKNTGGKYGLAVKTPFLERAGFCVLSSSSILKTNEVNIKGNILSGEIGRNK